jgi:hypothetical protein
MRPNPAGRPPREFDQNRLRDNASDGIRGASGATGRRPFSLCWEMPWSFMFAHCPDPGRGTAPWMNINSEPVEAYSPASSRLFTLFLPLSA